MEMPLYHNYAGTVDFMAEDGKKTIEATLKPAFGWAQITTQPEQGATLIIDNQNITDKTPFKTSKLPSGKHRVTARLPMYKSKTVEFTVNDNQTAPVTITLEPDFAEVTITTSPESDIYIDDIFKSKGTFTARLAPGPHTLEARKEKHTNNRKQIEVAAGMVLKETLKPIPRLGNVDIISDPIDATVKVDGQPKGTTPITMRDMLIGDYELVLEKPGYGTVTKTITINEGKTGTVNETLPSGKVIELRSTPAGAKVYVDGRYLGIAPIKETLAFGTHALKMVHGEVVNETNVEVSQTSPTSLVLDVAGFNYKDVYNPATGKTWMDRNLGASRVATSSTDAQAYGYLYQWGRAADGHESRTSSTTSTRNSSNTPGHDNFILERKSPYDWRSPQNDNLWQGINGTNNPCPAGYRLPTAAEWEDEMQSWGSNNAAGAFGSPLKLPVAGNRYYSSGSLYNVGSFGLYWSSTVDGTNARGLYFRSSVAGMYSSYRASGFSVRCIKNKENIVLDKTTGSDTPEMEKRLYDNNSLIEKNNKSIEFSLKGRTALNLHEPQINIQKEGKVVVEIIVDREGNVISAIPGIQGSTTLDSELLKLAKKAALNSKFSSQQDAVIRQRGIINYVFKLK